MSAAGIQNLPETWKKQIKDTLNPYFTKKQVFTDVFLIRMLCTRYLLLINIFPYFSYGDEVRNPVLLLNFLHQRSLISKPEYNIRDDPNKQFYFIGTCSLSPRNLEAAGPWKVEGKTVEIFLWREKERMGNQIDWIIFFVTVDASSKKECKKRAAQKFLNLFLAGKWWKITRILILNE